MKKTIIGLSAIVALTGSVIAAENTGLSVHTRSAHFLTDAKGMALYTFDKDELNMSNCKGGCLDKWPRLSGAEGKQVAYRKHPLYYFFKDTKAGQTNGDHKKGVWHLAYPAKGFKQSKQVHLSSKKKSQSYLTDVKGMALYTFDKDTTGVSSCYNGCEVKWPVYQSNLATLPKGIKAKDLGTITRKNGAMQTTYKGKPLYYFFKDTKPKQTNGDWAKGVWHLVEIAK